MKRTTLFASLLLLTLVLSSGTTAQQAQHPPRPLPETLQDEGGPEMVLIPAGEFLMGSTQEDAEYVVKATGVEGWGDFALYEARRRVNLPAFYIAKYEVTNEDYKKFVDATAHRPPGIEDLPTAYDWTNGSYPPELVNHPVVLISHEDAEAYCRWLSQRTGKRYRLPTQEEWEKAASWDEASKLKRRYPWGNEYNPGRQYGALNPSSLFDRVHTMPVGSVEFDKSPYGAYDMGENVSERVAESGVLKGGSFALFSREVALPNARCAHRWQYSPGDEGQHVWRGFRVARHP